MGIFWVCFWEKYISNVLWFFALPIPDDLSFRISMWSFTIPMRHSFSKVPIGAVLDPMSKQEVFSPQISRRYYVLVRQITMNVMKGSTTSGIRAPPVELDCQQRRWSSLKPVSSYFPKYIYLGSTESSRAQDNGKNICQ